MDISSTDPVLYVMDKERVNSKEHVMQRLQTIVGKFGEGLFFRKLGSQYLDQDSFFKMNVCAMNEKDNKRSCWKRFLKF